MISKKYEKIILYSLIFFSFYCAIVVGRSWDEGYNLLHGKITLEYLFSLGKIDKELFYRESYSSIYWSLQYLITQIFPNKYEIEISHITNLVVSLGTIFGLSKLSSEFFNKKIGKITFLILFFYPVFFGHMGFNSKDTILAFSHVWITYLLIKYLKNQNITDKRNKYTILIGILSAVATGIQILFLGSLLPIILFISLEVIYLKKFSTKYFDVKKFFLDLLKCFVFFYLLLVLFWIDTHSNILTLPFKFLAGTLSDTYWTGWPFNLVNGNYYISSNVPKNYLFISLLYKSPEYMLLTYLAFPFLIFFNKNYFKNKFKLFYSKIYLICFILIFPNIVIFFLPYPLYDGLRLFLWTVPYACILPAITIYYILENINKSFFKFLGLFLSVFIFYFLFNFFQITPYQYTYLNFLNGKSENKYTKFENDYWAVSIKELIMKSDFKKNKVLKFSTCGVNKGVVKKYLLKKGYRNFKFVDVGQSDHIIMTNRVVSKSHEVSNTNDLINCFDKFKGDNIVEVKRGSLILSSITKL